MEFKKIAGPIRVDGPAVGGSPTTYTQAARSGGRNAKVAQYAVKIIAGSSNAKVGVILEHGPDGDVFIIHSTPLAPTAIPATLPGLLIGDAGSAILCEYLRTVLTCISSDASVCWAMIEVYEMRKPF